MKVELLLERSANVIVHEHATKTAIGDKTFGVQCGDTDYVYPLANLSWAKVEGGKHYGNSN